MTGRTKKFITLGICLVVLFTIVTPYIGLGANDAGEPVQNPINSREGTTVCNVLTQPVGCLLGPILLALGTIIRGFLGWFLSLSVWLAGFTIDFNSKIMDQQTNRLVFMGWGIIRDIVNLGFVLVIVVISLATILRFQTYSAKKLLPRLIAAAILVNFSLTIAGVFIDFSNTLTNFFLNKISGDNFWKAAGAIGAAFEAQRFSFEGSTAGLGDDVGAWLGTFSTQLLVGVSNLIFIALFMLLGIFTMLMLAIMFLLRYLWLSFLLLLSPIIWLFWVIPALSGQFSKWWKRFFEWIFFAPAAAFFVYLALFSQQALQGSGAITQESKSVLGTIDVAIQTTLSQGAQMLILMGIMVGGLIVAKNMGIAGAAGAVSIVNKAGGKIQGWAGRQAIRASTRPLRGERGQKFAENLQRGEKGFYKAASYVGGRQLGNALSSVGAQQGERQVKQAEKAQKEFSDKQLALRVSSMGWDQRVAALTRLTKKKGLNMVPNLARYIADPKTKGIFESYGKSKEYGDLEKAAGFNTEVLRATSPEERTKAMVAFRKTYSIKDYDGMQANILNKFDKDKNNLGIDPSAHEEIRKSAIRTIFGSHPGAIAKIRPKLKGEDLTEFQKELEDYIEGFENSNLPTEKRGIKIPIKVKLEFIDEKRSQFSNLARGWYNARKNFGGSLFGGGGPSPAEKEDENEEEEKEEKKETK